MDLPPERSEEYPGDPYARRLLEAMLSHGDFVHAESPSGKKKNVVVVKTGHPTVTDLLKIPVYSELLDQILEHQDHTYASLKTGSRLFFPHCRFILEKFDRPGTQWSAEVRRGLAIAAKTDNDRRSGDTRQFNLLRERISQGTSNAPIYLLDYLNASYRFAAQCAGRYDGLVLPGTPMSYTKCSPPREYRCLVERALTQRILDEELASLPTRWREDVAKDHEAQHAHVQRQVDTCPEDVHTVFIVYGADHVAHGYHRATTSVSPCPLERYLTDHRLFIFEPLGLRIPLYESGGLGAKLVNLQTATLEELRLALEWDVFLRRLQVHNALVRNSGYTVTTEDYRQQS